MPTKAELKSQKNPPKLRVRRGDKVVIIAGKDKGEQGFVYAVDPTKQRAIVLKENDENPDQPLPLNAVWKHRKARRQGERSVKFQMPSPVHISNLMVLDPKSGLATRVGRRLEDGKLVRFAKKSGETIAEAKMPHEK